MRSSVHNDYMPVIDSESSILTMEQHNFFSPSVEDESSPPFFSGPMYPGSEEQRQHSPSLPSTSGDLSLNSHHIGVFDQSAFNSFVQQHLFSLSDPMHSTIMLRRNAQSARCSSTSPGGLQNLYPRRVRMLIDTLRLDDQRKIIVFDLIMAAAPFFQSQPESTPPAPDESDPNADALRDTFGSLTFSPNSSTAAITEEEFLAGNNSENSTRNLLFDANAAETLGSHPIAPHSNSPPLLLSTAMVEEQLNLNAEPPAYYSFVESINTIIEDNIQLESVTEEDWALEGWRVAGLDWLMANFDEDLSDEGDSSEILAIKEEEEAEQDNADGNIFQSDTTAKGDPNEGVVNKVKAIKKDKAKGDSAKSDLTAEGDPSEDIVVTKGEATENGEAKGHTSKSDLTVEEDSNKVSVVGETATIEAKAREDTSTADQQRWKEQGPDGWLKRKDWTLMYADEIDEECARLDAIILRAKDEKAAQKLAASRGKNVNVNDQGFWECVRSSKQKEQDLNSISIHGRDEKASASTHDQDEDASQKKKKKGSRKKKNKNRKAKKNALKGGASEDALKEEMEGMLGENANGSRSSPVHLQRLDLDEILELLTEGIKTAGLTADDGKATTSDAAKMPVTDLPEVVEETMSQKSKRKALEAEEGEVNKHGRFLLKMEMVTTLDEADKEEISSQNPGSNNPSVYSEHGKKPHPAAK